MSTVIFQRQIKVANVATDADSTPTISITRLDTNEVVVAMTSTGVTHAATGQYTYIYASAVAGVTYRGAWTFAVSGQTISASSDIAAVGATASGYYAVQSDVENVYGTSNVAMYSDLENTGTANTARILTGLQLVDARINNRLKANNVATPVATSSTDFALLTDIAAKWTGAWLYESRGVRDEASDGRVKRLVSEANAAINVLCLPGRLDAQQAARMAQCPYGVTV